MILKPSYNKNLSLTSKYLHMEKIKVTPQVPEKTNNI